VVHRAVADNEHLRPELAGLTLDHWAEVAATAPTFQGDVDRLTVALASTDEKPHAVIKAIAEKERRVLALKTRIDAQRATPTVVNMEIETLEQEARRRIEQFRDLLDRNSEQARKAMDALLESPLTFTPIVTAEGNRYRVEGPVAIGNMFTTEHAAEMAAESGVKLRATPTGRGVIGTIAISVIAFRPGLHGAEERARAMSSSSLASSTTKISDHVGGTTKLPSFVCSKRV